MKIAHLSDIHIRLKERHEEYDEVFENLYRILREKNPDLILLTGDIVHSKITMSPELVQKLAIFFTNLQKISQVVMIPGNHDLNVRNKDRLDALTPIVDMVNENIDGNIIYYKETGLYEYGENIVFGVWSQADGKDLILKKKNKLNGKIYIGLYHGAVVGCELDSKYTLKDGFASLSTFANFDYVMLGDIHKRQILDEHGRVRYAGSLIQQNYGEDVDKGFLMWDIENSDEFDVEFIKVPNDWCYYTIRVTDEKLPKLDDLTKNTRMRVIWDIDENQISRSEVNKVSTMIKETYNPHSLRLDFKPKKKSNHDLDVDETLNIRDENIQKDLLIDWLKNNTELDDNIIQKIVELDKKANEELSSYDYDDYTNTSWSLNKIVIDNFLSYGKKVEIDFDKYSGIIGLFGENASGKSVLIDAILYALFNKTTRNVKGEELICKYTDSDVCSVEISITIKNTNYRIERKTRINRNKSGEVLNSTTLVNFKKKYDNDKKWENLTGERRLDTEKIIRNVVGSYDDFLTTTLSSQNGNYEFSEQRPAIRVENVMRFLGLDIFRRKYEYAKEMIRSVEILKDVYNDYDSLSTELSKSNIELVELKKKQKSIKSSIDKNYSKIDDLDKKIDSLKLSLNNSIDIDYTVEDVEKKIFIYDKEKIQLLDDKDKLIKKIESLKDKVLKVSELRISDEEYDKSFQLVKDISNLEADIIKVKNKVSLLKNELSVRESNIIDVECPAKKDPNYISCVFLKDISVKKNLVVDTKINLEAHNNVLIKLKENLNNLKQHKIIVLNRDKVDNKLKELEDEIVLNTLSLEKIDGRIETIDLALSVLNEKIDKFNRNLEIIDKNNTLLQLIDSEKKSKNEIVLINRDLLDKLTTINTNINILESDIKYKVETLEKISSINESYLIYSNYKNAVHRRGIPIVIMKKYVPKINFEINEILNLTADFNVFFVMDDDTKLDIVMKYGPEIKDTRPISMASGMEKLLINLTIRYVLLRNNFLCKCGTHFIDEGFGVLDDDNIMSIQKFFENIKPSFNNIVFITHINTLKDCADHIIMVNKEKNISKLIYS